MQINLTDSCRDRILGACDIAVSHAIKEMRNSKGIPLEIQKLAIIGGMVVVSVQEWLAIKLTEDATNAPQ